MDFVLFSYLLKLLAWSNPITGKLAFLIIFISLLFLLYKKPYFKFDLFKEYKYIFYSIILSILLFYIMVFNSIVINNTYHAYTISIYMYVYFFIFIQLIFFFFDTRKLSIVIKNIINLFLIAILITIIIDLIFLYDYYIANYQLGFINYIKQRVFTVYYYRGCGFFSDPTAHVTIIFILPVILFISHQYRIIKTTYFIIGNIIGIISVVLSTSKIGIPLYLFEIFILDITRNLSINYILHKIIKYILLFLLLILILFYISNFLDHYYGTSILSTIKSFNTSASTITQRLLTYKVGLDIIEKHIIFGIGFNQINQYLPLTIHNTFIQVWAENGIFGLIYTLNIFIILPLILLKNLKSNYLKTSFISFYIIFFLKINIIDVLHTLVTFIYFYIIILLIYIDFNTYQEKENS